MWWSHRASSSSSSASRDCDTCTLSELLLPTRPCPGGEVSTWRITNPHLKTLGSACNRNLFAQAAAGDAASIARYSKQLILLVMPGNRYERDHVTTAVLGYYWFVHRSNSTFLEVVRTSCQYLVPGTCVCVQTTINSNSSISCRELLLGC